MTTQRINVNGTVVYLICDEVEAQGDAIRYTSYRIPVSPVKFRDGWLLSGSVGYFDAHGKIPTQLNAILATEIKSSLCGIR